MATLTAQQIAGIARSAGFQGDGLRWAVAVALAESGGRPDAVGVNSDRWRSRDRGLWQINDHWHPEVTDAQAFDPQSAAAAAYRISGGGRNWRPWATYTNGSAAAQLGRATQAAAQPVDWIPVPSPVPGLPLPLPVPDGMGLSLPSNPLSGIESLAATIAQIGSTWIHAAQWVSNRDNWLRVALAAAGLAATIGGIILLTQSGVGGPVGAAGEPVRVAVKAASTAARTAATKGAK